MRRLTVLVLVLAVLLSGVPFSASAAVVEGSVSDVSDRMHAAYGYTDESYDVGRLADDLGASPEAVLGLCALVDSWVIGSGVQRLTASQMANVASGAHTFMTEAGTWDSFSDAVSGGLEVAGGVLLDLEPWYDALGFSSLAEDASYGPTVVGGLTYTSGEVSAWPGVSGYDFGHLVTVGDTGITSEAYAVVFNAVLYDPTFWVKTVAKERYYANSAYYLRNALSTSSCGWLCCICGYQHSNGSRNVAVYTNVPNVTPYADATMLSHAAAHIANGEVPSEAAVVIEALAASGAPGHVLLAASALSNPGGVSLAAVDAWGIPSYLPPGAVHDTLDFADSWGDDLSGAADALASKVASLPLGFAELGEALASVMSWIGGFFDNVQSAVYAWFVPNPDWMRLEVPRLLDAAKSKALDRAPFSVIEFVGEARQVFITAGGS